MPGEDKVLLHVQRCRTPAGPPAPTARRVPRWRAAANPASVCRPSIMVPVRGLITPISVLRVVLLPAPFRPSSATTSLLLDAQGDVEQDVAVAVIAVEAIELRSRLMLPPPRRDRLPARSCCAEFPPECLPPAAWPSCSTVIRSASSNRASISCSTMTMVRPRRIFLSSCTVSARSRGLMPASGSSSSSSVGEEASAKADLKPPLFAVRQVRHRARPPGRTRFTSVDASAATTMQPGPFARSSRRSRSSRKRPRWLRQPGDLDVLPDGQPGKELIDLVAFGQPQLTHAGDVQPGDILAVEQDPPLRGVHLRRSAS